MSSQVKVDYNMEVQEPWFSSIGEADFTKRKTVEGRVGNATKHLYLKDKIVKIKSGNRYLYVKIKQIEHYDTLEEYVQAEGWKNVAPHANSYLDTLEKYSQVMTFNPTKDYLIKVFGTDRIKEEGGINALHLELLSPISVETTTTPSSQGKTSVPPKQSMISVKQLAASPK
jgi:ASC-1-like (ASCH) protein